MPAAARESLPKGGGRYQVGVPYQIAGTWYKPSEDPAYDRVGMASWYGDAFHGRLTANGEVFDSAAISAAHPTLPLPSYVRVTNLENNRSIIVRVNDRGPYAHKRLIDVSERTAEILDFKHDGMTQVRVEYVDRAKLDGADERFLLASYRDPGGSRQDANVMLASAEPRRPALGSWPTEAPLVLASLAVQPNAGERPKRTAVAFTAGDADAGSAKAEALEAVGTLSSAYDADARIAMAFEMAGTLE
jgi:rare lipoprotein A